MNGQMVNILAEDYFEIFLEEKVSPKSLQFALKKVKAKCRFFPKIVDFMDEVRAYRENPPRPNYDKCTTMQIADQSNRPMTDEEAEAGLKKVKAIIALATGDLSMDRALEISKTPVVFDGTMKK